MTYGTYARKEKIYDQCPSCGGQKTKVATRCVQCKAKTASTWHPCDGCSSPIRSAYKRCRSCYESNRISKKMLCVDCGAETKQYASANFAKRCWPCEVSRRRSKPKRLCTIGSCSQPHMAKDMCRMHYQMLRRKESDKQRRGLTKVAILLKQLPCQICGYNKIPARIHRIVPGGLYRPPNIVALCSNCHAEIHAGVAVNPPPLTEDEILGGR